MSVPYRRLLIGLVALAVALLGALPSVTARADQPGRNWQVLAGGGTADSAVVNMAFYPSTITIDVGDSVTWTFEGDAHTVTFLSGAPQPSPLDPSAGAPAGGATYDGTGIVSSGIVPPIPGHNTYTLAFTKAGTFRYVCLLHPGMAGTVIVQPAGTPYPMTQAQYDEASAIASQQSLAAGVAAMNAATTTSSKNPNGSTNYHIDTGTSAGRASVMRFLPNTLTISVGDSVTWTNPDMMDPHTVTFAPDGKYPEFPSLAAFTPAGGSTYDGSTFTNSGLIVPMGSPALPGTTTSYTLTFTKPGVYTYHCLLHDSLGMIGKIRVVSAPVTTPPAPLVTVSNNPHLGPILTDAQGHTLYYLTSELGGAPTQCTGACLSHWTPLSVPTSSSDAVEGPGVSGVLSVNTRADGINQVSYGEEPLYAFAGDKAPGDIHGEGIHAFGGVWLAAQVTAFPLVTPLVTAQTAGVSASFVVSFASSQPGQGEVYFGPGPACSGLVEVATQDLSAGTTIHTIQVAGNDMPGTVGDNGIQPGMTYSYKVVTMTKSGTETGDNNGTCYSVTIPGPGSTR